MPLRDRPTQAGPLVPVIIADIEEGTQLSVVVAPGTSFEVSVSSSTSANDFIYKNLLLTSGPQSATGNDYDINTNSAVTPSVFEYEVPAFTTIDFSRCNIFMTDGNIGPNGFAGLAALSNGCLFEIIDSDGTTVLLDFLDGVPLTTNDQFTKLAGVDTVATFAAGDDFFPIRFTMARAGKKMRLTAGQRIRWTNQDNLSAITRFQFMVQGVSVT
jgi:hypothetical protein